MRVVSWNLGYAIGLRTMHDRAWHYIAALDPDLAMLQEVRPQLPPWVYERWTVVRPQVKFFGSAILAKPDLRLASLPGQVGGVLGQEGYVVTAIAMMTGGSSMLVASIHAPARPATDGAHIDGLDPDAIRRPSAPVPWSNDLAYANARRLIEGQRFLVSGDWNVSRLRDTVDGGTAGAEFFERAERDGWRECYRVFHAEEGRTWFHEGDPPYQVDHAFCDAETAKTLEACSIYSQAAEDLKLSDHAPMILEFKP